MLPGKTNDEINLVASHEYNRVFNGLGTRGFDQVSSIARTIPKYMDAPEREADPKTGIGSLMFGVAEVFFGLLVVLSMIGLVAVGLFIRGR